MRATQRTVALCRRQHHGFAGKCIQIGGMNRIALKIHFIPESVLTPESHCLVTVLVGKYIDNIGMISLCRHLLWNLATLCRKQSQATHQKIYRFIHDNDS